MEKIYLDNQATTKPDPRVINIMSEYYAEKFGNTSSIDYARGWNANEALSISRKKIARIIGANPEQIILTSGATESINLAIRGTKPLNSDSNHNLITFKTEHRAVLDTFKSISSNNYKSIFLDVNSNGKININKLEKNIDNNTIIVSVLHANNEIGTIQNIKEISELLYSKGIILHIDAAQSVGKIPIDISKYKMCMLSFSSHKIYGPQGIGGLYISNDIKKILRPQITGGGHQFGFRSGTLPIALTVGFGKACEIALESINCDNERIIELTQLFEKNLKSIFPDLIINGHKNERIPGNLNITLDGINNRSFIMKVPEIALSRGSACTSSLEKRSHVLSAIGLTNNKIDSSIRFGIGRFNTKNEINEASNIIESRFRK